MSSFLEGNFSVQSQTILTSGENYVDRGMQVENWRSFDVFNLTKNLYSYNIFRSSSNDLFQREVRKIRHKN